MEYWYSLLFINYGRLYISFLMDRKITLVQIKKFYCRKSSNDRCKICQNSVFKCCYSDGNFCTFHLNSQNHIRNFRNSELRAFWINISFEWHLADVCCASIYEGPKEVVSFVLFLSWKSNQILHFIYCAIFHTLRNLDLHWCPAPKRMDLIKLIRNVSKLPYFDLNNIGAFSFSWNCICAFLILSWKFVKYVKLKRIYSHWELRNKREFVPS